MVAGLSVEIFLDHHARVYVGLWTSYQPALSQGRILKDSSVHVWEGQWGQKMLSRNLATLNPRSVIMDHLLDPDLKHPCLDPDTDKIFQFLPVQKLTLWISFWVQKLTLWASGTLC